MTEYHFFVAIKVYIIKSSLFIRNVIEIFLKGCHGNTKTPPTSTSLCLLSMKFEYIVTNIFQVNNFIRFL